MSKKSEHTPEPTGVSSTVERSPPSRLSDPTPYKEHLRFDDAATRHPQREATMTTATTTMGSSTSDSSFYGKDSSPQSPQCPPQLDYIPHRDPKRRDGRTLVVCFDGTGDQFDLDNSNVVSFVTLLKKDDNMKQRVYYQAGIGTYTSPAVATPIATQISKTLDEMFAWNLNAHVIGGYEFLMQNYRPKDRICIFGFSRGAYTAQSLAGMLHKVGLLPIYNYQQVPFAYKMYKRTDNVGWKQSTAFKKAFSIDVQIEFLGVWDTVASVGGIISKTLPFTSSNTIVKTFRHALALDERRAKFKPKLWKTPTEEEQQRGRKQTRRRFKEDEKHGTNGGEMRKDGKESDNAVEPDKPTTKLNSIMDKLEKPLLTFDNDQDAINEAKHSEVCDKPTDVKEVWFAGCHCDVGGGSVKDDERYSLARIPLRWMVRECFEAETGILFLTDYLPEVGLDPGKLYPSFRRPSFLLDDAKRREVKKRPRFSQIRSLFTKEQGKPEPDPFISEELEELEDALSPIYDPLKIKWLWWLLELFPVSMLCEKTNGEQTMGFGVNRGKARTIPLNQRVKVHRSVKLRMGARGGTYRPKAKWGDDEPDWID